MKRFDDRFLDPSLREFLNLCSADELKQMAPLLPGEKLTVFRKAVIIEAIERCLLGPGCEGFYKSMEPLDQLAVQEAVHSDFGEVHPDAFLAKHGKKA